VGLIANAKQHDVRCSARRHNAEIMLAERRFGSDLEIDREMGVRAFNDAAANRGIEQHHGRRAVHKLT
jgi:hypothetical protein